MSFVSSNRTALRIVFLLIVVTLLWFGTFGLLQHMSMMNTDGGMGGCLFGGQQEACILSLSDHAALWQQMIATTPFINLLILAFIFVLIAFWYDSSREFSKRVAYCFRLYIRQHPYVRLFNALLEALSSGILNRKVFVPVRV